MKKNQTNKSSSEEMHSEIMEKIGTLCEDVDGLTNVRSGLDNLVEESIKLKSTIGTLVEGHKELYDLVQSMSTMVKELQGISSTTISSSSSASAGKVDMAKTDHTPASGSVAFNDLITGKKESKIANSTLISCGITADMNNRDFKVEFIVGGKVRNDYTKLLNKICQLWVISQFYFCKDPRADSALTGVILSLVVQVVSTAS